MVSFNGSSLNCSESLDEMDIEGDVGSPSVTSSTSIWSGRQASAPKIDAFAFTDPIHEAAKKILQNSDFTQDNEDVLHSQYGSKGEVQGRLGSRQQIGKIGQIYPGALDPSVLRENKEANFEQYLILQAKRLAHCLNLDGQVTLPNNKRIKLEGFNEVFTNPMLATSLESTFPFCNQLFNEKEYDDLIQTFNQTTRCDILTASEIQEIAESIQDTTFEGPICLSAGYDWHVTFVIFYKDYIFDCNRGNGSEGKPGIYIYKINRQLVTPEIIKRIAKRQDYTETDYFNRQAMVDQLSGQLIYYHSMKIQKKGICTYTSLKAGGLALMAIKKSEQGDTSSIQLLLDDENTWEALFKQVLPFYKKWSSLDAQVVISEFLNDIQELMEKYDLNLHQNIELDASQPLLNLTQQPNLSEELKKQMIFYQQFLNRIYMPSIGSKKLKKPILMNIRDIHQQFNSLVSKIG